jgi:hypothetical protein
MLAVAAVALELSGPSTTAFAATCAELRRDTPALTCTRIALRRAGGHPVEIWATLDEDDENDTSAVQIFVAIETHEGWYLANAFDYEPEHQGEHCHTSTGVARFAATSDRHAATIDLVLDDEWVCPVSDYDRHYLRRYLTARCTVDELVPRCTST